MSNFKVGQRVRIVNLISTPSMVGKEATILSPCRRARHVHTGVMYEGYDVEVDGVGRYWDGVRICLRPFQMVPLTDPRCSEFIADMERFNNLNKTKVPA